MDPILLLDFERQISIFLRTEKEFSIALESLESLTTQSTSKVTPKKVYHRNPKKELCARWEAVEDLKTKSGNYKAKSSLLGDVHKRHGPYQTNSTNRNHSAATELERQTSLLQKAEKEYSTSLDSRESLESISKATPGKPCIRNPKKEFFSRWKAVEEVKTKIGSLKARSSIQKDVQKRKGPYTTSCIGGNPLISTDLPKAPESRKKDSSFGNPLGPSRATINLVCEIREKQIFYEQCREDKCTPLKTPQKLEKSSQDEKPKPKHDEKQSNKRPRPSSPFAPNKKWKPSKDFSRQEKKVKRLTRLFKKLRVDS